MPTTIGSMPRTIRYALKIRGTLIGWHRHPMELATVFGPSLAVIIRSIDIGIGVIVGGADQNGGERAWTHERSPAVAATHTIAVAPN